MPDNVPNLPENKRLLLQQAVELLAALPGMAAVVLGGSYASGAQHAGSDLDIGLYYEPEHPFAIDDIHRVAGVLAEGGQVTVTGFYEWGAWVNGGAWIHTPHGKVDFLYRSLEHVRRTIDEAEQGVARRDYEQQPTSGFYSVIYLAETHICIPLYDPAGWIAALKRRVERYPPRLKHSIIANSLWSAEFTLLHARGFAARGDIYNTAGCLSRAAADLTQALFALNERYFIRDKQVLETIAGFALLPPGYVGSIQRILSHPGATPAELAETVGKLERAWSGVLALPGVGYEPKFRV